MSQPATSPSRPSQTPETAQKVQARTETIETRDGQAIVATVYAPSAEPERVVIVAAATGVKQAFYEPYARYLAKNKCAVISFDYRGIGRSLKTPLKQVKATIRDWGREDYPAVIDFARAQFPGKKLQIVGHSVGGQLVGMLEHTDRIDAVITVAAQHGYWRLFPWRQALTYGFFWYVVMPLLARLYGYFPSGRFKLGENLPKGVALEWARFARSRHYMIDRDGTPLRAGFRAFTGPVLDRKSVV